MCGLAGIVDTQKAVTRDRLTAMTDIIDYRGPDEQGHFLDGEFGLGHRRLSIIDLSTGQQPMFSADRELVTVFNGEIYNYLELRAELEKLGHRFATRCDTETILYAYREWGERCVERFRGMFAIAILDRTARRLFLARDFVGIKPLYYHWDGRSLLFASEVKPILTSLGHRVEVNHEVLDFYMSVGYVPGSETFFKGIRKLEPGHSLTYASGELSFRQFWDLEDTPVFEGSFEEASERFRALASESVRLRLASDVPLGAFLSGGLDSSAVVALMTEHMDEPVKTFSVGYRDAPEASELDYARVVASHFSTDHHEFVLDPLGFFESLDLLLDHTEEPVVESAAVALYQLSKLAKEHVTVILSGEGGDEILAGYPLHKIMPKVERLHRLARLIPRGIRDPVGTLVARTEKTQKYLDWVGEPMDVRYQSISNDVTARIKRSMYANGGWDVGHRRTAGYFSGLYRHYRDASDLRRMTYSDIKSWLPEDLLLKADRMTMAASLELRVPFLDHRMIEFATSLPDHYRLNGNEGKHLLKKTMEGVLPYEIIYRKKKGFPVPIARWFRGELYERAAEVLLDSATQARGYFKPGYAARVLERHRSGREDLSRRIFSLLALEFWHRKYVD